MVKKKFSSHIIAFVFKLLCTLVIIGVVGVIAWRLFSSGDPSSMKALLPNSRLCEAYEKNDGKLEMITQKYDTITRAEHNSGYFSVTSAVFVKTADQAQIIFRYNNSTLEHVREDMGLSETPARDSEIFDVTLVVVRDLSPDNTEDNTDDSENISRERIHASESSLSEQKNLYNFRKFFFDGVVMDHTVIAVYVDIYYADDIDYTKDSYGTLRIYHKDAEDKSVSLSNKDRKAIEGWLEDNK